MGRPPRYSDPDKVNLNGERSEIADAHVFAARKDKSLSKVVFDLLRPLVMRDKAKSPESYGDRQQATSTGAASK